MAITNIITPAAINFSKNFIPLNFQSNSYLDGNGAEKDNYRIYLEVWVENEENNDFELASTQPLQLKYGSEGQAETDLKDILHTILTNAGPDYMDIASVNLLACKKSVRKFYYKFAESIDNVLGAITTSPNYTVIYGGLSYTGSFSSSLLAQIRPDIADASKDKFLRQGNAQQFTRSNQPQFLYFLNTRSAAQGFLNVKFFFTNGSTINKTITNGSLGAGRKYVFNLKFEAIINDAEIAGRQCKNYEVWLTDDSANTISETRTFHLNYQVRDYVRYFLYYSSWGSIDTLLTYGKANSEIEITQNEARVIRQAGNDIKKGDRFNFDISVNTGFKTATGFMSKREIGLNRDFFLSPFKFRYAGGNLLPIGVTSKTIAETNDGNGLYAQNFDYKYQFDDDCFTEGDIEDNGLGIEGFFFNINPANPTQTFSESDPTVPYWVKAITAQQIANWNAGTGAGGTANWGQISGSISAQTDLINFLTANYYASNNPAGYISGINSSMVTSALGFSPYNSSNPASYISGINSSMVTSALGFTPYNSSNPAGYISASALSPYQLINGLGTAAYLNANIGTTYSGAPSSITGWDGNTLQKYNAIAINTFLGLGSAAFMNLTSGDLFNRVPFIAGDGVFEIGRYIDAHYSNNQSLVDFDYRLEALEGGGLNIASLSVRVNGIPLNSAAYQPTTAFTPANSETLQSVTTRNKIATEIKITNKLEIPGTSNSWEIYVDENGSGGNATSPPIVANLSDLADVTFSGLSNGQALVYQNGFWVNQSVVTDLSNYYSAAQINANFASLAGYNKANWDNAFSWGNHAGLYSTLGHTHAFSALTGKPTTIAGYGITDIYDYTVGKTGAGASGNWGIDISGTASYSNSSDYAAYADYAAEASYASSAGNAGLLGGNPALTYGANGLNYFSFSGTAGNGASVNSVPQSNWYHILRMNHGNGAGYYVDIASGLNTSDMWYRRITSGVDNGWVRLIDSNNIGSQSVNLSSYANYLNTINGANIETIDQTGVFREEFPSSGFPYTTTLNMSSFDGRQQITVARDGGGMKFRGSSFGSGSTWGSWKNVIHSGNIADQYVAYSTNAGRADGALKFWATSHPNDYHIVNNWTGTYWMLTSNHPSPVGVGFATSAETASYWGGRTANFDAGAPSNTNFRPIGLDNADGIVKPLNQTPFRDWLGLGSAAYKSDNRYFKYIGSVTSNSNANDFTTDGAVFNITGNGSGNSNYPDSYGILTHVGGEIGYTAAQNHYRNDGVFKTRTLWGGTWTAWREVQFKDELGSAAYLNNGTLDAAYLGGQTYQAGLLDTGYSPTGFLVSLGSSIYRMQAGGMKEFLGLGTAAYLTANTSIVYTGSPSSITGWDGNTLQKYNAIAINTFLGMPAGGDTLQSVMDRGSSTSNFLKITGLNNIPNGDGLEFYYDGTSHIQSYGRGTSNAAQPLAFYASSYDFSIGNIGFSTKMTGTRYQETWDSLAFESRSSGTPGYAFHIPGQFGAGLTMNSTGVLKWNGAGIDVPYGSSAFGGGVTITGNLGLYNQLNFYGTTSEIVNRNASALDLYSSSSTLAMRLLSNGNVGIGTTNFNLASSGRKMLSIAGNSSVLFEMQVGGTNQAYLYAGGSGDLEIYGYQKISFAVNGLQSIAIQNTGNVGIGYTTDQGYKLAVNGTGFFTTSLQSPTLKATSSLQIPERNSGGTVTGNVWELYVEV